MDIENLPSLFDDTMERSPDVLLESGIKVIDQAFESGALKMIPLFSGGHDSLSACFLASHHSKFDGNVYHIDTTIGSSDTQKFVREVCAEFNWNLSIFRSNFSYEKFVTRLGFPGPGSHQWVYNKLKDRCVSTMTKGLGKVALITGCRSQESIRRMGHVKPLQVGEKSKKTGQVRRKNRLWTAPCHDWSGEDQKKFMDAFALPRNPIKMSALSMSGECFCGAFARPNEIELIKKFAPDVAVEIDRLSQIPGAGTWGVRGKTQKGLIAAESGPLCSSCDFKARASGILWEK